jgi:hypothetical protein
MPIQPVNREELGKLIAQTSGTISMINESNYKSNRNLVTTLIQSLQPILNGPFHTQILRATMPSASMYMQLNIIVVKVRHLSLLSQAVSSNFHLPITVKQSVILLNPDILSN